VPEVAGIVATAHRYGVPVHCDGARIWNASIALGVPPSELLGGCDSVMFCLSKGLAAPIGSVLCGSADFIAAARADKHRLGGGWRQAGIVAAAGIVALETMVDRLADDHARAHRFATALAERWPDALDDLRAGGFTVVALTPAPNAEPIDAVAARCAARPVALLLGAEGPGLGDAALAAADHRACIPLRAGTDSLNVGHAAAIALYEFGYHTPSRTTAATTRRPSTDAPTNPA